MAKTKSISKQCPMELGMHVLSGKWKLQIVWLVYQRKIVRFNEVQRSLGNITTKTLTEQLRELEAQQIITRKVFPCVPPKVEYSLTSIGLTLEPVLTTLCTWGKQYAQAIEELDNN